MHRIGLCGCSFRGGLCVALPQASTVKMFQACQAGAVTGRPDSIHFLGEGKEYRSLAWRKLVGGFHEGSLLEPVSDPDTATLWTAPGWFPLASRRSFFEASQAQPKDPSA